MKNAIGNKIRELRVNANMRQEDLANLLQTDYGMKTNRVTVVKWENGKSIPETQSLRAMAQVFGVSMDYISDSDGAQIGNAIKSLREQKGLSQDELAQMTGYSSRSAISRIEAGERDLSSGKIKLFADALEVSPSELIDYNSEFAKRLREAMSISGLNQTKLAERTGISKSSLCHYMKGDWKPKQDAIHKIAAATGTKEGWLAGYEDEPQETENCVGNTLRELRLSKGKTLEEVGEYLGVTRQTISRYETGAIRLIPKDVIEKLATFFDVNPSVIMGWKDSPVIAADTVGSRIRNLRKSRNMKQHDVIYLLKKDYGFNTPYTTMSRWENDKQMPETDKLIALAEIFGVSVDDLTGIGKMENPMIKELTDICRTLSTEKINALIAIARIL